MIQKFSFAVTAYNEITKSDKIRILDCIAAAQEHPAVSEIVIVDDASGDFESLVEALAQPEVRRVVLSRNQRNLGVFGNKLETVALCRNDWVINCDSDNVMDRAYLDRVTELALDPYVWYCPSFARPHFDYRRLVGEYDHEDLRRIVDIPGFGCLINTGNQIVNRSRFLAVFDRYRGKRADLRMPNWLRLDPEERHLKKWRLVFDAKDSFIYNLYWLWSGGSLRVVDGLEYDHYVPEDASESNYARAPKEKDQLDEVLMRLIKERIPCST